MAACMCRESLLQCVTRCVVVSLLLLETCCVRIDIVPDRAYEHADSHVHVSCVVDLEAGQGKNLLMIEISNEKDDPIASINAKSRLSLGVGIPVRYQVQGQIDADNITESNLQLQISNTVTDDSGTYTCRSYYKDGVGLIKNGEASGHLVVEATSIAHLYTRLHDLEALVRSLNASVDNNSESEEQPSNKTLTRSEDRQQLVEKLGKINDMAENLTRLAEDNERLSRQIDGLKIMVSYLEGQSTNQSQQIQYLTHKENVTMTKVTSLEMNTRKYSQLITRLNSKASDRTAFYATMDRYTRIYPKTVLGFSDVIMRLGTGYNESSGVFTAPKAGVYVFNLVLTISEDGASVMLCVNDKEVAILICYDKARTWDQSSVSAVVDLKVGDEVKAVVERTYGENPMVDSHRFSLFSGYLL